MTRSRINFERLYQALGPDWIEIGLKLEDKFARGYALYEKYECKEVFRNTRSYSFPLPEYRSGVVVLKAKGDDLPPGSLQSLAWGLTRLRLEERRDYLISQGYELKEIMASRGVQHRSLWKIVESVHATRDKIHHSGDTKLIKIAPIFWEHP